MLLVSEILQQHLYHYYDVILTRILHKRCRYIEKLVEAGGLGKFVVSIVCIIWFSIMLRQHTFNEVKP